MLPSVQKRWHYLRGDLRIVNMALQIMGARWPSGLERWLGLATGRSRLGSNPAATTSLRNFGNSVYPTSPVSFGGDTKICRSLLSGVYCQGSKITHQYVNIIIGKFKIVLGLAFIHSLLSRLVSEQIMKTHVFISGWKRM